MFNIKNKSSFPLSPPSSPEREYSRGCTIGNSMPDYSTNSIPRGGKFTQLKYPQELYKSELKIHNANVSEYECDIYDNMAELIGQTRPNIELYKQQPYLTFPIRQKLVDFLLKISNRLKIIPFVFFKAVRLFDRYCSKRIVLLDQAQLIITTCLWIASKVQGGNNHFVNLNNLPKLDSIKTINDIGYGSGGKYLGPTERFRLPKLHELVKLCGAKCSYDVGMFKQMEVHILNTLEWSLNDPSIEEFIMSSHEFSIMNNVACEMVRVKTYLSYVCSYSSELIDVNVVDLGQVILDVINETFKLSFQDINYQTILNSPTPITMELERYKRIKRSLIKAIIESSEYMLILFNSRGPQFLYHQILNQYKVMVVVPSPITPVSPISAAASFQEELPHNISPEYKPHVTSASASLSPRVPPSRTNNNKISTPSSSTYYPRGGIIPPPHQLPYHFHSPIDHQPPLHRYKNYTPRQRKSYNYSYNNN
ncbi:Hypha-specific G1 cyclin-related protein 1 [Spathaspora sp. JA1]|nr:Hypha-specific G1 cyclin-related protein 1 [Spathaspora sp. JA1]